MFSQNLEFSEDKIEMTFATNYLGSFLILDLFLIRVYIKIEIIVIYSLINTHHRSAYILWMLLLCYYIM